MNAEIFPDLRKIYALQGTKRHVVVGDVKGHPFPKASGLYRTDFQNCDFFTLYVIV